LKIYRKGHGALKMISKDLIKEARKIAKSQGPSEEANLEAIIDEQIEVRVQLMLNQGYCYWKNKDWDKMKKINFEVFNVYDPNNIKAYYRFAIACQKLETDDEGLVRFSSTHSFNIESNEGSFESRTQEQRMFETIL